MGYKRAGDLLVQQAERDPVDRQNIIYVALFCYRQSVELCLKALIEGFGESDPKDGHNLIRLWDRFMLIANQRGIADTDGLETVAKLVGEMHSADERADGFRFASRRDGSPFSVGEQSIDLPNLRDVMNGVVNFFECAHSVFSEQDYWEQDYLATVGR